MEVRKRRLGQGQTLVEYVLIIATVAVVAIGALNYFGQALTDTTNETVTALSAVQN